jgi:hypothetical protein
MVAGSISDAVIGFSTDLILPVDYDPGVDSISSVNDYQDSSWLPALKADKNTAICELTF